MIANVSKILLSYPRCMFRISLINTKLFRNFSARSMPSSQNIFTTSKLNCDVSSSGKLFYRFNSSFPSHKIANLPSLSPTMETGTIASWSKHEGDKLDEGDVLCQIETDKAVVAMETSTTGYLAKILYPDGTKNLKIGEPIAVIVKDKKDVDSFKTFSATQKPESISKDVTQPLATSSSKDVTMTAVIDSTSIQKDVLKGDRIHASPYAKRLSRENGIDLSTIVGSGPGGRIISKDLLTKSATVSPSSQSQQSAGNFVDKDVSTIRATIAKRLVLSKTTIPHFHISVDIFMSECINLRTVLNKKFNGKVKISFNDFVIKATALALMDHPQCNSHWMETFIRQYNSADISNAVATDNGLMTPVIFNAASKTLANINKEMSSLADKARQGKLTPADYTGGTFTISNLGMFGITTFTPIINPPQSCILAVGCLQDKPINKDGKSIELVPVMTATLGCDHRVVDGAVGALWLNKFKEYMENPVLML